MEILTKSISKDQLWLELRNLISILKRNQISEIVILFGFAWGNTIYENDWLEETIDLDQIEPLIRSAEKEEHGEFGSDDIFLTIPEYDIKIQYCHHADIHLSFNEQNEISKEIIGFWEKHNWLLKNK